jgi:DNA-binding winged helix-turn-helix (wHTH) protein/Flp pilus assembly protein TadD
MRLYEFGPFRLDPAERLLLRDGNPVSLTSKAFDVLLLLVQNSGHLIQKDEILRLVWPNTFVEEGTLAQNVFLLRKTIKDRKGRQYIQTVPKRGYRFVAKVIEIRDESDRLLREEQSGRQVAAREKEKQTLAGAHGTAVALTPTAAAASENPNVEYLSDVAIESLINSLSQLPKLRVIARSTVFRYKGRERLAPEAGNNPGVRAVISGNVTHWDGSLSIQAELVDIADRSKIRGRQYTQRLADLLLVLEELSREVAEELQARQAAEETRRLTKSYIDSSEAYQLYLKGRYYQHKMIEEGFKAALECFQRAIAKDSNFALAYTGLADNYALAGIYLHPNPVTVQADQGEDYGTDKVSSPIKEIMSRAKAAALRALEIDDALAEAYASMGLVKYRLDWDWLAGERELKRALELNPDCALAHHRYSMCLQAMGRLGEAEAEALRAQELDPLLPVADLELGRIRYFSRQYDEAIERYRNMLKTDPTFLPAHFYLGQAYELKGLYKEAIAEFRKAVPLPGDNPEAVAALGHAYAVMGRKGEARKVLDKLRRLSKLRYVPASSIAMIYTGLGDKDQAFKWLNKAYDDRSAWPTGLKLEPMLDSLRSDPRFEDLLLRVGLAL